MYKPLWVRTHSCPHCGTVLDRDYNAALNILHKAQSRQNGMSALKEIGTGCPEYTPAEMRPILEVQRDDLKGHPMDIGQAESMKQEAPCESVG